MRATHTDYLHPRHLRVEGCGKPVDVLCVSPSSSDYAKLSRPSLPKWKGSPS